MRSDFVEWLTKVLGCSLGAVVGAVAVGPLATLQESMAQLGEELFVTPKAKVLAEPLDFKALGTAPNDDLDPFVANATVTRSSTGGWVVEAASSDAWTSGVAFSGVHGNVFQVSVRLAAGSNTMLGIAPAAQVRGDRLAEQLLHTRLGFYLRTQGYHLYAEDGTSARPSGLPLNNSSTGALVSMRFVGLPVPSLAYSVDGGAWVEVSFNSGIPAGITFCPVLLLCDQSSCVVEDCEMDGKSAIRKGAIVNPVAKFLICNDLKICESSSLKAFQLVQKLGTGMTDLEVVAITVTVTHLQRMLGRAIAGEHDVLQYTFGADDSPEGSEHSFLML